MAMDIFELRKGKNEDLSVLECLQICDKKEILVQTDEFVHQFMFSKNRFRRLVRDMEIIRNELAHSQASITNNLEIGRLVDTISDLNKWLFESEKHVDEMNN